jgi:hypothetical protein
MPAIQPAILRQQAALLAEHFFKPSAYIRSLHHLLEFYADHTRRPGKVGEPNPLLASHHVHPAVLRQVLVEIEPLAIDHPDEGFLLCDALWAEEYWEFRWLASALLGKISPTPSFPIIDRINLWVKTFPERRVYEVIIEQGCTRLQNENIEVYLNLLGVWLSSSDIRLKQVGLCGLRPLVRDQSFENLPIVYQYLQPLVLMVHASLRSDVVYLLKALVYRSPNESAYFFRQSLSFPEHRDVPYFIRQTLENFPPDIQENLRIELRKNP